MISITVEPAADRSLRSTDSLSLKLAAFLREYGHGSLLLLAADAEILPAEAARFEKVWRVASLADLAHEVAEAGLLTGWLDRRPLRAAEFTLVRKRLHDLCHDTQFGDALELIRRVWEVLPPTLSAPVRRELVRQEAELCRHLGQAESAERLARDLCEELRQAGDATSFEEQLTATVEHAAAFYDWHRFAEMTAILEPWLTEVEAEPRRFQPETRVRLFNTLARARVILGQPGWEDLFRRSLALLAQRDPFDQGRTHGYLIHGLLRQQRREEARAVLDAIADQPTSDLSRWWLRAYEAEWARQTGQLWTDAEMEVGPPPAQQGHPFAFYLQATARQRGRSASERQERFGQATRLLEADARQFGGGPLLHFLAHSLALATAMAAPSTEDWKVARDQLAGHLAAPVDPAFAEYYRPVWSPLAHADEPNEELIEALLQRIPYT